VCRDCGCQCCGVELFDEALRFESRGHCIDLK
jgi:hypothetical protein